MNLIEKQIVNRMVEELYKEDWFMYAVNDGEDVLVCSLLKFLHDTLDSIEAAEVYFTTRETPPRRASVTLIFDNGNYGIDVISDYSCKYEDFKNTMEKVSDWASETDWMEVLLEKLEKYDNRYN